MPKVIGFISVWDFLLAKSEGRQGFGQVQRSPKEKLQDLTDEVEGLLRQLTDLWQGCCLPVEDVPQVCKKPFLKILMH